MIRTSDGQNLPTGVVTFLLTDVVDSALLWDTRPAEMAHAMARHDAIVRQAVLTCGGILLKSRGEGDSTFSVFQRATDAVYAARAMALALEIETWPEGCTITVRSAMHSGEALERDGDYYGPTVNRAARLRDSAVSSEILLTQSTVNVVLDHLPQDCSLLALGLRSFRGINRPESVHSLVIRGGTEQAPDDTGAPASPLPLPVRMSATPLAGFHGRAAELGILQRRFEEARDGHNRCLFIAGEPGIGKSTLAGEVARAAHVKGATILYGRCEEDVGAPYGPWAGALSHVAKHASPAVLDALGPRNLGELAHVVPELTDRFGSRARPVLLDPESQRYVLFGAVATLLRELSKHGPLVVVLDDLQWADKSTLLLLRHIVTLAEPVPALIIATYRHSDLTHDHPLTDLLAALRRESSVDRLSLTGLARDELLQVIETVSGQTMTGHELDLIDDLHRETGGNPFFAWEIMLHLSESGLITLSDEGTWVAHTRLTHEQLPESVREVIAHRVARLGPRTQRTLETAAVIGGDFSLELLAAVVDESQDEVLEQIEAAEAAGLVQSVTLGHFAFAHGLVGHSLYIGVSATRRARTHLRIAEAFELLGLADDEPAEMVRHWTAAGGERSLRAIPYAQRAAAEATAALAPQEAMLWLERAMKLLQDNRADDPPLHCDLLIGLGQAQLEAGDGRFRDTLLAAAAVATTPEQLVRAALTNYRGFPGSVDHERIAVLEAALGVVGDGASSERAKLLARLAAEWGVGGDFPRRRKLVDDALATLSSLDDPPARLHVLNQVTPAITVPETLHERIQWMREAVSLAEQLDNPLLGCLALLHSIQTAVESVNYAAAEHFVRRLHALSHEVAQPAIQWMSAWAECTWVVLSGDIPKASELADRALQLGIESGQPDATTIYGGQLLSIRWHQGRDGELVDMLSALSNERDDLPILRAAVARIRADLGECIPVELETVKGISYDLAWATSLGTWAEVAARCGTPEAQQLLYEKLLPYPDYVINIEAVCLGSASHYLGLLAAAMGELDKAGAHFAHAERAHELLRAPFHLARTRLEWGRSLLKLGSDKERSRALELLEQAKELAVEHGCAGVEREASALLG